MSKIEETCKTCRYFSEAPEGNQGACRRFPPNSRGEFGLTHVLLDCGEWRATVASRFPKLPEEAS